MLQYDMLRSRRESLFSITLKSFSLKVTHAPISVRMLVLSGPPARYTSVWDEWMEQVTPFASRVPFLVNMGNHEFDSPPDSWPTAGPEESFPNFRLLTFIESKGTHMVNIH
jgi:hypothetical protein